MPKKTDQTSAPIKNFVNDLFAETTAYTVTKSSSKNINKMNLQG